VEQLQSEANLIRLTRIRWSVLGWQGVQARLG